MSFCATGPDAGRTSTCPRGREPSESRCEDLSSRRGRLRDQRVEMVLWTLVTLTVQHATVMAAAFIGASRNDSSVFAPGCRSFVSSRFYMQRAPGGIGLGIEAHRLLARV